MDRKLELSFTLVLCAFKINNNLRKKSKTYLISQIHTHVSLMFHSLFHLFRLWEIVSSRNSSMVPELLYATNTLAVTKFLHNYQFLFSPYNNHVK